MRLTASRLFETIHPMTYLFVTQSVAWAMLLITFAMSGNPEILGASDEYMFWPEQITYVWAVSVILASAILFFFFLRDFYNRPRSRIWLLSKVNICLWVFSGVVWIVLGFWPWVLISFYNIIGFTYIGLASKLSKFNHRV